MKTLSVTISDEDAAKYELSADQIDFEELMKKIRSHRAKEALDAMHRIAKETGLDKMTMEEIDAEIQAARNAQRSNRH